MGTKTAQTGLSSVNVGDIEICGITHSCSTSDYLKQHYSISTVPMFSVIKDHITQCKGAANGCVFNSFWTNSVARRMRYTVL